MTASYRRQLYESLRRVGRVSDLSTMYKGVSLLSEAEQLVAVGQTGPAAERYAVWLPSHGRRVRPRRGVVLEMNSDS